jgi:hypothetical protein
MSSRIATSIVALAALMAGTISPIGVCALMCETHLRAQVDHHCGEDLDQMPRMAHNHSAMHHSNIVDMTFVVAARSCHTDCAVAERQNIARKVVPQVTAARRGTLELVATSKFLPPPPENAWSMDSSPPSFPSAHTASYSILRI